MRPTDPAFTKLVVNDHLELLRGRPLPRRRRSTRGN